MADITPGGLRAAILGAEKGDPFGTSQNLTERRRANLERCVSNYNKHLAEIHAHLSRHPSDTWVEKLAAGKAHLETLVDRNSGRLASEPCDLAARNRLKRQRSIMAVENQLIELLRGGASAEDVFRPVDSLPEHVSSYSKAVQRLKERGLVKEVSGPGDVGAAVREASDYTVLLLGSYFRLPAPIACKLVKDPEMLSWKPEDCALNYLVGLAVRKEFKVSVDTIRNDRRYTRARQFMREMRKDSALKERAKKLVADIGPFKPINLWDYSRLSEVDFEEQRLLPDNLYYVALRKASRDDPHMLFVFRDFGRQVRKVQRPIDSSLGLRMLILSDELAKLRNAGEEVPARSMIRISAPVDHGSSGTVPSFTYGMKSYDIAVHDVADYPADVPFPPEAYSLWPKIGGRVSTQGTIQRDVFQGATAHDAFSLDKHFVAMYAAYAARARRKNQAVICPILFLGPELIAAEQVLFNQAFVMPRTGRNPTLLNMTETDSLLTRIGVELVHDRGEKGYDAAFTTKFGKAYNNMRKMYGID